MVMTRASTRITGWLDGWMIGLMGNAGVGTVRPQKLLFAARGDEPFPPRFAIQPTNHPSNPPAPGRRV